MPNLEQVVMWAAVLFALPYVLQFFLWICWIVIVTTINDGWRKAMEYDPDTIRRIRKCGPEGW